MKKYQTIRMKPMLSTVLRTAGNMAARVFTFGFITVALLWLALYGVCLWLDVLDI